VAFIQYGEMFKFPRNENIDIHVREVTLNADAPPGEQVRAVDIREFIKNGELYGHGVMLPMRAVNGLQIALEQVTRQKRQKR
jgi:hypothetical protein